MQKTRTDSVPALQGHSV